MFQRSGIEVSSFSGGDSDMRRGLQFISSEPFGVSAMFDCDILTSVTMCLQISLVLFANFCCGRLCWSACFASQDMF